MNKRLLVVGGGYAGTEVIRQLVNRGVRNLEVELVSARRHFENTIAGTELISEKMKAQELQYDLKELSGYWGFERTVGSVESINLDEKMVNVGGKEKGYDVLVLATGSEPNCYDVKGVEFIHPAYTLSSFTILNERLGQLDRDNPNVVVAGAGFVGLEVTAEILDLFKAMNRKVTVTVIEKMNSVLPAYNNDPARKAAFEQLSSRGARFILGKGLKRIEKEKLVLSDGSFVEADLAIWTAGIRGSKIVSEIRGSSLHKGYIEVDERLLIKGREDSFALGDAAFVKIARKEASKMAGEALEQAKTTAKNISLLARGRKPHFSHAVNYSTDFPKVLLSMGEGKAMLIFGPHYVSTGATEYFLKKRVDVDEIMWRFPQ